MLTTTQQFFGSIQRGRGTPWSKLTLVDLDETVTTAVHLGVVERADDGEFYGWAWGGTRIRFLLPPRLLPWSMRDRRRRLMARTVDGRYVGPFTIGPG